MMHCINCAMFCEIILVSINVLYYFSYSSLCSFKAMLFTIDRKNFCYSFFVHRLFNTSCNNTVFIFITLQLYLYRYLYFSAPDPYLWSLALAPNFFSRPWPQILFPWFQNMCFPAPGLYSCLFICFSFVKCLSYCKEIVTFFCLCKIVYSWVPNNWGDNRRFRIFSIYY